MTLDPKPGLFCTIILLPIAKNTLYDSTFFIFLYVKKYYIKEDHVPWRYFPFVNCFSIHIFSYTLRSWICLNSLISATYCLLLTNHTWMQCKLFYSDFMWCIYLHFQKMVSVLWSRGTSYWQCRGASVF